MKKLLLWAFFLAPILSTAQVSTADLWTLFYVSDGKGTWSPMFLNATDLFDFIDQVDADDDPLTDLYRDDDGNVIGVHRGRWAQFVRMEEAGPAETEWILEGVGDFHYLVRYKEGDEVKTEEMTEEEAIALRERVDAGEVELLWDQPFYGERATAKQVTTNPTRVYYLIEK
jgi:hypothetical protein